MKLIDNRHTTDAAVNLALEEYCVRHMDPEEDYLLFYVNQPVVIIGAHQNPWQEVNHQIINRNKIPVYRRVSGGGAVYHDGGNLNVAYITRHNKDAVGRFDIYMRPIIEVSTHLGLMAVCARGNAIFIENKKISGFAQFGNLRRTLTHGTLLFNSDLEALNQTLTPKLEIVETKAIASVKKKVANLLPLLKTPITMDNLVQLLKERIDACFNNAEQIELSSTAWHRVHSLAEEKYRNWEWVYGRSPLFAVKETVEHQDTKRSFLLQVNHGLVDSVDHQRRLTDTLSDENSLPKWHERLINKRYFPGIANDLF